MRTKTACFFLILLVVLGAGAGQARASYLWTATGTAYDGRPDNGMAMFSFASPTSLSITLWNTAGPSQLGGISSVLDGVAFSLTGTPSDLVMTGAHAAGTVSVTNKQVVFNEPSGGITQAGANPFNWSLQQTGTSWQLFAGKNQSFKPDGIVNRNLTATDGITNRSHNPYLDGPVTFYFDVIGLSTIPDVSAVSLYFGTGPDIQFATPAIHTDPVPLPPALLLFGSGLIGLVVVTRKLKK